MSGVRSRHPKVGETRAMRPAVEFACPFCGKNVIAGWTDDGSGTVLHGLPPCATYLDLSADRFLEACRKRRES